MSLNYYSQVTIPLIGSKSSANVVTPVTLKDYYDYGTSSTLMKAFPTEGMTKLELIGIWTAGTGETSNSLQISIEASSDRTNWGNILNESVSGATSTIIGREFSIAQATNYGTLTYDTQTANFTVGLKVTGAGGATGYILSDTDAGAAGTLLLSNVTGTFVNNEALTDSGTGSAAVDGVLTSITKFSLPIDISNKYYRVAVKETGVASNAGTLFLEGVLSGK